MKVWVVTDEYDAGGEVVFSTKELAEEYCNKFAIGNRIIERTVINKIKYVVLGKCGGYCWFIGNSKKECQDYISEEKYPYHYEIREL